MLAIVDYAASRAEQIRDWLSELVDASLENRPKLRLLLERQASRAIGWLARSSVTETTMTWLPPKARGTGKRRFDPSATHLRRGGHLRIAVTRCVGSNARLRRRSRKKPPNSSTAPVPSRRFRPQEFASANQCIAHRESRKLRLETVQRLLAAEPLWLRDRTRRAVDGVVSRSAYFSWKLARPRSIKVFFWVL